eukprot:TRINITY_DN54733_c0_g1_i1.p1 TRINITY_DN54733_c0_g1~~TRINITY_DN54733_c0_g1_i1.p1  ORF type:complete len:536 (+),score=83.93 TRINITY_DN54733_c0_g1_i1:52-1659(+)
MSGGCSSSVNMGGAADMQGTSLGGPFGHGSLVNMVDEHAEASATDVLACDTEREGKKPVHAAADSEPQAASGQEEMADARKEPAGAPEFTDGEPAVTSSRGRTEVAGDETERAEPAEPAHTVQTKAAQPAQGVVAVPPIPTISLTRPPAELPPQFAAEFEADDGATLLGEGAYACVRRLRHKASGSPAALKVVEKQPLAIRNMLTQLGREVGLHSHLRHPRILQLLACVEDTYYVYMLLEFCGGGSLASLAGQLPMRRTPEPQAAVYFAQVLQGVDFMHRCNIVHRDLKPDNILLTHAGEVRICDFGWSAEIQIGQALQTTCGTPNYWPPEIYEGRSHGIPLDLWSLGNLVYEMLVGHAPFWGTPDELRHKVLTVDLRYPPNVLSNEAINLFYCFLQRTPTHRVPAGQLLQDHPWVVPGVMAAPPMAVQFQLPSNRQPPATGGAEAPSHQDGAHSSTEAHVAVASKASPDSRTPASEGDQAVDKAVPASTYTGDDSEAASTTCTQKLAGSDGADVELATEAGSPVDSDALPLSCS